MNHPTLYSNAYKEYRLRLQSDYHYALSAYCSEKSISYSGMKNWLLSRGIFVRNLQAEAMAAYSRGDCASASGMSLRQDSFIRFRPVNNASSGTIIKGVTYTFNSDNTVNVHIYDVFAGSCDKQMIYIVENGEIWLNPAQSDLSGEQFKIVKLTKDEMEWQRVGTIFTKGTVGSDFQHFVRSSGK